VNPKFRIECCAAENRLRDLLLRPRPIVVVQRRNPPLMCRRTLPAVEPEELEHDGYFCPSPRKVPKRVNYDFSRCLSRLDEPPAVTFDISPVGSVEKCAGIIRSAALRRGHFEQKACFVKSARRKSAFGTFRGDGQK
jgi:hypothetical protein